MTALMLVHAYARTGKTFDPPEFLERFDVEAFDGRGDVKTTLDPAKALRFADKAAAMRAWHTESKRRPLREDGRPNKPLTALTVEIIEV